MAPTAGAEAAFPGCLALSNAETTPYRGIPNSRGYPDKSCRDYRERAHGYPTTIPNQIRFINLPSKRITLLTTSLSRSTELFHWPDFLKRWLLGLVLPLLALTMPGCTRQRQEPPYYSAETSTKSYQDVLAELEVAITERNFRITGHNKIGSVIRERENIAFPDYDTIQFCNLTEARVVLEISPAAVVWMPCNVTVRSEAGKVIVTTHLLPSDSSDPRLNELARQMNEKLKEIVNFAVED